ncbi:hypothetical protein CSKR_202511 [Clonorchis sinensis]|uniref:UBA domain-containing protein n=1 Tax=Clonorchis sinensis TaxID=79923 RepID=A0A8T1MX32_CLOSI|nr:hypothetical protein CSKR_202511 [Clonorchis sinensis]
MLANTERIETMVRMGFEPGEVQEALTQQRFRSITAPYILIGHYDPKLNGRSPGLGKANNSTSHLDNKLNRRHGDFYTIPLARPAQCPLHKISTTIVTTPPTAEPQMKDCFLKRQQHTVTCKLGNNNLCPVAQLSGECKANKRP